jgi:hypothetical protein
MSIKKLFLALLLIGSAFSAQPQGSQVNLRVTQYNNQTITTNPDSIGVLVYNDQSTSSRNNDNYSCYVFSAAGNWSLSMAYSDSSAVGPWISFGSAATIDQSSSPAIANGLGHHRFIQVTISGAGASSVMFNYAAWSKLYLAGSGGGGGGVTFPITIGQGGTGQTTALAGFNALSPMLTNGDMIYGGTSGSATRLAPGTSVQVLHSGAAPAWGAVNLATDVTGLLPNTSLQNPAITITASAPLTGSGTFNLGDTYTPACPTCTTNTSVATSNAIMLGAGAQLITPLGDLGTTAKVLHGNASGAPSFGNVVIGDIAGSSLSGNGSKLGTTTGSLTSTHCVSIDASSNFVDSGAVCGGAGVTSVGLSIPNSVFTVTGTPVTSTGTLTATPAGTSGGIVYFSGAAAMGSSALLAASQIVLGGGAATAPATLGSLGTTTTVLHGNAAGVPSFGAVVLTTDVSGVLPAANGGTVNGFFAVSGPATSTKTFTFPNASSTVLTDNAAVTVAQGGTGLTVGVSGGIPYFSSTTTMTSSSALTLNRLVAGGGAGGAPTVVGSLGTTTTLLHGNASGLPTFGSVVIGDIAAGSLTGNGTKLATSTGTLTNGNCVSIDASGNFVDFGGLCGGGGGGGTVTSVGLSIPNSVFTVTGTPVIAAGTLTATPTGTSGGVVYFSGAAAMASSALLAASQIVLGGGAGTAPATLGSLGTTVQVLHGNAAGAPTFGSVVIGDIAAGSLTGTGSKLATSTGALVVGHCVAINGVGDYIDSGGSCGASGVTSVAETFTGGLISVSGSPITSSGTFALTVAGTSGGIPYFSSASTWATSAQLLPNQIVLGGGAGAAPATLGSLGTTTTLLHGNAAGAPTFGAVVLTTDVSGTLPVTNGGLGIAVGTSGGIPYFSGTTTIASSAALTVSRIVLGGGAGAAPTVLGSLGTTSTVLHGNAAGAPSFGAVSLTAEVSGILPGANGGTNNGFMAFAGPITSLKTFTLPNSSANILTDAATVTVPQGGTGLSTGTSGGIMYFSTSNTLTSSNVLGASQLVLGGGAGVSPATLGSLGTTTTLLHGNAAGVPSFGAVVLTTDVSGILPGANGGTANGFFAVSGPATSLKTFTFPNASATVLTTNAAITVAQGGTGLASGTSGGILCFTGTTTLASSSLLASTAILIGGGAGVCPTTSGVTIDGSNNISTPGTLTTNAGSGSPSSFLLTNPTHFAGLGTPANGTVVYCDDCTSPSSPSSGSGSGGWTFRQAGVWKTI